MFLQNIKSNIPNLSVYVSHDHRVYPRGSVAELHYHDEIELLFVYSGHFACRAGEKEWAARAGDIIFIASGAPHSTVSLEDGTSYGLLQFKESDYADAQTRKIIKYSLKFLGLSEEPVRIIRSEEIFREFERIKDEQKHQRLAYEAMIRSAVLRIIALLTREGLLCGDDNIYNSTVGQKILPALSYINENYRDDITLEDVSAVIGFNESYFCRIFKLATGATFTEYLNFVRVCKAQKLLSESSKSILDISSEVGFSSVSYFNRIFKKYRSCSPGYYRTLKYCKNI